MSTPQEIDASTIRLTAYEADLLVQLATTKYEGMMGRMSNAVHEPNRRLMSNLAAKGLVVSTQNGTYWEITDLGRQRCTTIY